MAAEHCVDDNGRADQRQWDESQPNLRTGEVLRGNSADLRANGRAGVHNQRDQNVHITFNRVAKCAVAGGDDNFEKISAHCEMRGNSQHVDHGRHANVTGAAAEKTTEYSADESHQKNYPK